MPVQESFIIELSGRSLHGTLFHPEEPAEQSLAGTLICISPARPESETNLIEALIPELVASGRAAVTYHVTSNDPEASSNGSTWKHIVDDASAAFRWMALHDLMDLTRLGLIGYGQGAVTASCLARRTDQVAGLCLIAPAANSTLTTNGVKSESSSKDAPEKPHPIEDAAHFDRPTMILVAGADKEVACSDFQSYLQGMENVEHQVRHLILARADHGFTAPPQQKLNIDRVVDFFSSMKALVSAESDL